MPPLITDIHDTNQDFHLKLPATHPSLTRPGGSPQRFSGHSLTITGTLNGLYYEAIETLCIRDHLIGIGLSHDRLWR